MKRLVIEMDDALHKEIKLSAIRSERTMKEYVLNIVSAEMKRKQELQEEKET